MPLHPKTGFLGARVQVSVRPSQVGRAGAAEAAASRAVTGHWGYQPGGVQGQGRVAKWVIGALRGPDSREAPPGDPGASCGTRPPTARPAAALAPPPPPSPAAPPRARPADGSQEGSHPGRLWPGAQPWSLDSGPTHAARPGGQRTRGLRCPPGQVSSSPPHAGAGEGGEVRAGGPDLGASFLRPPSALSLAPDSVSGSRSGARLLAFLSSAPPGTGRVSLSSACSGSPAAPHFRPLSGSPLPSPQTFRPPPPPRCPSPGPAAAEWGALAGDLSLGLRSEVGLRAGGQGGHPLTSLECGRRRPPGGLRQLVTTAWSTPQTRPTHPGRG